MCNRGIRYTHNVYRICTICGRRQVPFADHQMYVPRWTLKSQECPTAKICPWSTSSNLVKTPVPIGKAGLGQTIHGSLNVPIEHHPTIRHMVYNGYYKVMSNIPKMGQLPTPAIFSCYSNWDEMMMSQKYSNSPKRSSTPRGLAVDGSLGQKSVLGGPMACCCGSNIPRSFPSRVVCLAPEVGLGNQ